MQIKNPFPGEVQLLLIYSNRNVQLQCLY